MRVPDLQPAELWRDPRARLAAAALLTSLVVLIVYRSVISTAAFGDLKIYRGEGLALRDGRNVYAPLPGLPSLATYPVFATICFVPVTFVPYHLSALLLAMVNVALVPLVGYAMFRIVGRPRRDAVIAGMSLAAVGWWFEPIYSTFDYGQINLVLLALVLVDFLPGSRTGGVGTGLAAAIKVTPLIIIVHLVLVRRWRTAIVATGTFLAAQLLSLAVDASATWRYWTKYLLDVRRVGRLENAVNQTVRGLGVRFEHTRDTGVGLLAVVALVAVFGLGTAWLAHRHLGVAHGLVAAAVTGLLVSPVSWSHHWVWCIPLVALLWVDYARWAAVLYAVVFASFVVWWLPQGGAYRSPELHYALWQVVASGAYVYLGLGFLVATAVRARRVTRVRSPDRPDRETVTARGGSRTGGTASHAAGDL